MMKFIEEYNEKLGMTLPIPELELSADETMEDFLVRERGNISKAIAAAIDLMVQFEIDSMPCFAVKGTEIVFNISREDAPYSLDQCIQYFLEMEDYEKCARLAIVKSKL
jgi:hypothetical protein